MATVKGVWVFNSHLKQPLTSFGTCYVNFKSKDNPYTYLSIVSDSSLYYRTSDGGSYVYSFGTDTWTEEVYRIIDFGTTPQEVSASFYIWLTDNAAPRKTISGVWVLNESVSLPSETYSVGINFVSNGKEYTSLMCTLVTNTGDLDHFANVYYGYSLTSTEIAYLGRKGWTDDNLRTIDFGSVEQTIFQITDANNADVFYTWLTANATQQGKEETKTVKGTWQFNETPTELAEGKYIVSFRSCDKDYDFINCEYRSGSFGSLLCIEYCQGETDAFTSFLAYAYGSDPLAAPVEYWQDEAYRTVDFGNTEQKVSAVFYTWLVANATLQGEKEPTATATITYNSNIIAIITDGQTATLSCKGKKMIGDIVISYGVEAVNLISFTIDGTSYQAEEGMTWEQWANSSYNTAGAYATGLNYSINGKWIADARNGGAVLHQDAIKANREYFLKDHTGGGGND